MSRDYTRVITPLSTVLRDIVVSVHRTLPRALAGLLRRERQVERFPTGTRSRRRPATTNVKTPATIRRSRRSIGTHERSPYGTDPVEGKRNNAVNCRWISSVDVHKPGDDDGVAYGAIDA